MEKRKTRQETQMDTKSRKKTEDRESERTCNRRTEHYVNAAGGGNSAILFRKCHGATEAFLQYSSDSTHTERGAATVGIFAKVYT